MRKDVKYFLIFLLPICLFSYGLDVLISKNLKKSNKFAEKEYTTWNTVFEGKINSDLLIYGASRAWVQFNSTMIEDSLHIPTYNLGIDGLYFQMQYFRHKMLMKNNKKPKVIIIAIDMFSLEKRKELYNLEQFLPYMLWNIAIKDATSDYKGFTAIDYEIPLIRYYGRTRAIETAFRSVSGHLSNPVCRVKGFQARDETWNTDFDKAKLEMKVQVIKPDKSIIALFERFINECKQQNIELIFVNAPEYSEGQKFIKNREEVLAIYNKWSKQYHIPFYDYSKSSISFQKKYFYNSIHMNKKGAELFTAKLIDTLKQSKIIKEFDNE